MTIELVNLEEQNIRRMTKRECAIERMETWAEIAAYVQGPAKYEAFAKLDEAMEYAVDRCGFTWDEIEAIAAAAYDRR